MSHHEMDGAQTEILLELGTLQWGKYVDLQVGVRIRKVDRQMAFDDGPGQQVSRSMSTRRSRRHAELGIFWSLHQQAIKNNGLIRDYLQKTRCGTGSGAWPDSPEIARQHKLHEAIEIHLEELADVLLNGALMVWTECKIAEDIMMHSNRWDLNVVLQPEGRAVPGRAFTTLRNDTASHAFKRKVAGSMQIGKMRRGLTFEINSLVFEAYSEQRVALN
jgi:hypothetical protein